jgi:hypothetical protein
LFPSEAHVQQNLLIHLEPGGLQHDREGPAAHVLGEPAAELAMCLEQRVFDGLRDLAVWEIRVRIDDLHAVRKRKRGAVRGFRGFSGIASEKFQILRTASTNRVAGSTSPSRVIAFTENAGAVRRPTRIVRFDRVLGGLLNTAPYQEQSTPYWSQVSR